MKKAAKRTTREIAEAINFVAQWLEAGSNGGFYTVAIPAAWRWVMGTRYGAERAGILFYSTGWGWRVRTNPGWRSVFDERFYKLETDEGSAPAPGHVGYWEQIDDQPVHFLADPNMSETTHNALIEMVRAVRRMDNDGNKETTNQIPSGGGDQDGTQTSEQTGA